MLGQGRVSRYFGWFRRTIYSFALMAYYCGHISNILYSSRGRATDYIIRTVYVLQCLVPFAPSPGGRPEHEGKKEEARSLQDSQTRASHFELRDGRSSEIPEYLAPFILAHVRPIFRTISFINIRTPC